MIEKERVIESYNMDERLKDIFQRLLELYERQVQERQLILKDKEELNRLVSLLVSQTKEMGQYENGIRKRIQDCIREWADTAMKQIADSVVDKTSHIIENSHVKMTKIYQLTESTIVDFRAEKKPFSWKIISIVIIVSVLSSLFFVWLILIKPILL